MINGLINEGKVLWAFSILSAGFSYYLPYSQCGLEDALLMALKERSLPKEYFTLNFIEVEEGNRGKRERGKLKNQTQR